MTAGPSPIDKALQRQARLDERAALVDRLLACTPDAMRALPQWLVWKLIDKPGATKPAKVPFYVNGQLRGWPRGKPRDGKPTDKQPQVEQGAELDRAHLATLDDAVKAFKAGPLWAGIGFAFLPGDGLVGVDIDGAIDPDTGQVSDLCAKVVDLCASYTEASPSGKGVHIILQGETPKFKDDAIGLEVYAGGQYFTCTGRHWPGAPAQVQPLDPDVLAYMRELVDDSKARQAAAKEAEQLAARAAAPPPAPRAATAAPGAAGRHAAPGQQSNDFKRVNDEAYQALDRWVPRVLPDAVPWRGGYRISSKALGRTLQEDLQLMPEGIMDFGEEQGLSPIDVVLKWLPGMASPKDALHWLAAALGITLQRPVAQRPPDQRRPPSSGAPATTSPPPTPHPHEAGTQAPVQDGAPGDDPPPADLPEGQAAASNVVPLLGRDARPRAPEQGEGDAAAPAAEGDAGGGKRKAKGTIPPETWELVNSMAQRFALIYSTEHAWDRAKLLLVKISAMRTAFGKLAVNLWLDAKLSGRQMIDPVDLVFEPGQDVPAPQINMFAGLDLEPVPCKDAEVEPMLKLLRHLCSESETAADDVDDVMHWVLCWQALPLQNLGVKMATACVFHGAQGTGKNLYWDVWRDLFGVYGVTVGQTELEDKFNGWVSRKLAILGDEVVSRQEMYHNKNRLKLLVTQQDKFPIRGMNMETRWESNHANVVFLSNDSQPLALEQRDRRYMVIYTPLEADSPLYDAVRDFKAAGGAAKWLHYLMHYPVGSFTAHSKPLMTGAKEALIEAAWKPAARFVHEWLSGLLDLRVQVCSAEQLYRVFKRWCDMTGAKWPPDQASFTSEVRRWVNERVKRGADGKLEAPRLHYKNIALKEPPPEADSAGRPSKRPAMAPARKTVRCWLPDGTGPTEGVSEGAWAGEAVQSFETEVYRFCRRPGGLEDDTP
jgi:putative DNA primase/helicase